MDHKIIIFVDPERGNDKSPDPTYTHTAFKTFAHAKAMATKEDYIGLLDGYHDPTRLFDYKGEFIRYLTLEERLDRRWPESIGSPKSADS